ncbi:MAG: hypothetical protein JST62_02985 [Bacteroidetes bacterium]|nr:hypothetical protein [Bacteroidota bacterium]
MTLYKFLYKKASIKRKVLDIKDDIIKIIKPACKEKFFIFYYGAYDIDPRHLVYWICIKTDDLKTKLSNDKILNSKLRHILTINNYPSEAIANVHIGFESQETVDRESNGHWFHHFK